MSDTIAAVATGSVRSAIGIVRISGDDAIKIASRIFVPKNGVSIEEAPAGKLIYGDLLGTDGGIIDRCLCTVSRAPKSYTGENTAEFQCHGSPVVLSEALSALFKEGARQARAGEFTKRAFLNGKTDLVGAEAVIDLIDADTAAAAKNAAGQLGGAMSAKISGIYSKLLDIMSHFWAVIDWPDEDIGEFKAKEYAETLSSAENELSALLDTFSRGRILKEGVASAIVGKPNVGKSSLLNALLGYDRAIVTDVAGTTRDTVEEKCVVGGVLLRLIDTAGIRETEDTVEKIGVERSLRAMESAELILAVVDGREVLSDEDMAVLQAARDSKKPWILLVNKKDITKTKLGFRFLGEDEPRTVHISAVTGEGIDELSEIIAEMFAGKEPPRGEIITNARQADEIRRAKESLKAARETIESGLTPDAALTEVEAALSALGAITGQNVRENVISRIFERFCVGK